MVVTAMVVLLSFGSSAGLMGPVALRPRLAAGLPFVADTQNYARIWTRVQQRRPPVSRTNGRFKPSESGHATPSVVSRTLSGGS